MPASLSAAMNAIFSAERVSLERAVETHYTPDFRIKTNGVWSDRATWMEHAGFLRSVIADIHIEVLDELEADGRHAERHVVAIEKRDGGADRTEIYASRRSTIAGGSGRWRRPRSRSAPSRTDHPCSAP